MISQVESGDLIGVLTNIQSIYDQATNRTLLLRLRLPNPSLRWQELAKLADKLGQARENVGAVLKILIQKRNGGVELSCELRLLKPLQDVVTGLYKSLLAPIQLDRASGQSVGVDTETLAQVCADGQRDSLHALVRIFEEPQRKMSAEDRQSLAASLKRESLLSSLSVADCQRGARDSIFAPPAALKKLNEPAMPKGANNRIQYLRSASLGSNGPPEKSAQNAATGGHDERSTQTPTHPSVPRTHPQRSSSLAPIPVIEPEEDHVYVVQPKLPTPPEELPNPFVDSSRFAKLEGGFPFLKPEDRSASATLKPPHMKTTTVDYPTTQEASVPQFLSSPLSDSPMPKLPNIEPYPVSNNHEPGNTDLRRPDIQRAQNFAAAENALGRFSPFSEPDYEASGSYFAAKPAVPRLVDVSNNKQRAYGRPSSKTITGSHPLQHPALTGSDPQSSSKLETSKAKIQRPYTPPQLPSSERSAAKPEMKRVITTPGVPQASVMKQLPTLHRPQIPRSQTDVVQGPSRPNPFLAVPPLPPHVPKQVSDSRNKQRKYVLDIASPVDDTRETLPQPSAWNEYLGFCVGAALAQMNRSDAMIKSTSVNASSKETVHFLKCSSNKCAFQGHGPADKIWESSGVYFRREFLVKSHCKQKKARHAIYAFQCIFCVLARQKSTVIQGTDAFMAHVATHRGQTFSPAVLERTRCVTGRKAASNEAFDVNLPRVNMPAMTVEATPTVAKNNPVDMFQALHSNPVGR
ncbi:MAG: hypothetical protein Q9162_006673 [Coniocarpon cinnabarinum]